MGIRLKGIKYFEEITSVLEFKTFQGLELCELGDLFMRRDTHFGYRRASKFFRELGFKVTVIDLGIGREKIDANVLQLDLSKPIKTNQTFDMIVDYGTGEHITDQYEFHRNVHYLSNKNAVIFRSNPSNRYRNEEDMLKRTHGLYHYTVEFFTKLAWLCKYKIVDIREMTNDYLLKDPRRKIHIYASLIKRKNNEFPSREEFKEVEKELVVI
ncbi:MAG: hypothetical protein ACTSPB_24120 [Candidatus Thorarchaeota archaeon]